MFLFYIFCPMCGNKVSSENQLYDCCRCQYKWYSTTHLDSADKTLDEMLAEEDSLEEGGGRMRRQPTALEEGNGKKGYVNMAYKESPTFLL